MSYLVKFKCQKIIIVGCGGTGSLVSEGVCRLLIGNDVPLFIVDHDRVEDHNLLRQAFYPGDLGKFKAQVVAERLARQYGREIGYSIYPYNYEMSMSEGSLTSRLADNSLIIGCVDGSVGRTAIHKALTHCFSCVWLDSGNSYNSGQVLIGNTLDKNLLQNSFREKDGVVDRIPAPSLQMPELLLAQTTSPKPVDCAEAVRDDDQSPVINQAMATLVLEFIRRMLRGQLNIIAAYLDLDSGSLRTVPAEPVNVARMLSMEEKTLIDKNITRR
jgi:PRTRC genetic system ThiF family protein